MIEYTTELNKALTKAVKDFNAKVNFLTAQGNKYIPRSESVADIKNTYYDEDMLLRKIRQLEKFTESGAEQVVQLASGAKTTRWQLETLKEDREYLIRLKSKQMNQYGNIVPKVLGKSQKFSYKEMGDATFRNMEQALKSIKKDYTTLEQADFNKYVAKIRTNIALHQRQKYIFWNNYFQFIDDVAYKADVDPEVVAELKDKLAEMDIDKFKLFYDTEKAFSDILDDYNLQKASKEGYSEEKKQDIRDYFNDLLTIIDDYM